jgi:hypothetical protein
MIDWIVDTNLTHLNWRHTTLQAKANEYHIAPGECVVFENARRDKVRLIANIGGLVVLLIPPIDSKKQLSMYIEINEYLRTLTNEKTIDTFIFNRIKSTHEHISLRAARKEQVRKNREEQVRKNRKEQKRKEA